MIPKIDIIKIKLKQINQWLLKCWHNLKIRFIMLSILLISFNLAIFCTHMPYFYLMYHLTIPTVSNVLFSNKQNTSNSNNDVFKYHDEKIINYFPLDNQGRTKGVQIQISKADLVRNKQAVSPYLVPKGYTPYKFDSYNFKPFYLYSKQTLLSYPIIDNPNYRNNVYTLPTNIAQSGLFARSMYNKRGTYQFAPDKSNMYISKGKKYFIPNIYIPKHLKQGSNRLLISYLSRINSPFGLHFDRNNVQDSPNYIQEQLIKKLKQLPKGYHLSLVIKLKYTGTNKIPNNIDYQWCYLSKNKQGATIEHNYNLPIIHTNNNYALNTNSIIVFFPNYNVNNWPQTNKINEDDKYENNKRVLKLFKGNLDADTINEGYQLAGDPDAAFITPNPDAVQIIDTDYVNTYVSGPNCPPTDSPQLSTPLISCFSQNKVLYVIVILLSCVLIELIFTLIWFVCYYLNKVKRR